MHRAIIVQTGDGQMSAKQVHFTTAPRDHDNADGARVAPAPDELIIRHTAAVRVTHWINLLCVVLLLMSGLRIFNAHPALYWGNYGYEGVPSFISIAAVESDIAPAAGETRVGGYRFDTTGILGVSYDADGNAVERAFPLWATLPSRGTLGESRSWHFLMAWVFATNVAAYLLFGVFSGHFRRDLAPQANELRPRHILRDIRDHILLHRPRGEAARRYNLLQKLTYITVVFILLPVIVLTGLTMSPAVTALAPFLFDLFGGRQSARTIHFIAANLLLTFVLVHVIEVLLAGAVNLMRAMITGRYVVRPERAA